MSKPGVLGLQRDDRGRHGLRMGDRDFGGENVQGARAFERPPAEFESP
jgi:hypothetical protein